jgi:hypothetical protein
MILTERGGALIDKITNPNGRSFFINYLTLTQGDYDA